MDRLKSNTDNTMEVFKRATRSQNNAGLKMAANAASKRKAEASPKQKETSKRLAFVDLTNNGAGNVKLAGKKLTVKVEPKVKPTKELKASQTLANLAAGPKARAPIKKIQATSTDTSSKYGKVVDTKAKIPSLSKVKIEKKDASFSPVPAKKELKREKTAVAVQAKKEIKKEAGDDSYPDEASRISSSGSSSTDNTFPPNVILAKKRARPATPIVAPLIPRVPNNVHDFDGELWKDPNQVSVYAFDIFNYLRNRESSFIIDDYMEKQFCLNTQMRSLLVDWMVEVQESFELNHETLYLAVKIVDLYLSKVVVAKETLQLIGAAAVFIASKFDERSPPLIEDFLYICDGAYTRREVIKAESNVFKTIGYDLGIPLSYRFLRRFARCAKVSMPVLTLARFILESSLLDYKFVSYSDSKMACACMLIALNMTKISGWTPTLQHFTTYKFEDFSSIVYQLNDMLHQQPRSNLSTIRNKYTHHLFFEVAKSPLLKNSELWH